MFRYLDVDTLAVFPYSQVCGRACSVGRQGHPDGTHGNSRCQAKTVAWLVPGRGPGESLYHWVHGQGPCPTVSSVMSQRLCVMPRLYSHDDLLQ